MIIFWHWYNDQWFFANYAFGMGLLWTFLSMFFFLPNFGILLFFFVKLTLFGICWSYFNGLNLVSVVSGFDLMFGVLFPHLVPVFSVFVSACSFLKINFRLVSVNFNGFIPILCGTFIGLSSVVVELKGASKGFHPFYAFLKPLRRFRFLIKFLSTMEKWKYAFSGWVSKWIAGTLMILSPLRNVTSFPPPDFGLFESWPSGFVYLVLIWYC